MNGSVNGIRVLLIGVLSSDLAAVDLGHRDQETGAGAAHTEPLGQSTRGLREEPILWILPGHQGEEPRPLFLSLFPPAFLPAYSHS